MHDVKDRWYVNWLYVPLEWFDYFSYWVITCSPEIKEPENSDICWIDAAKIISSKTSCQKHRGLSGLLIEATSEYSLRKGSHIKYVRKIFRKTNIRKY